MSKLKNIPRAVVILGLISFFTDFASEMLYPITPIFLTAVLGSSMTLVGVIEGIAEVTAGFLKGFFGVLSDKTGRRSIFVKIGYGVSGFVKSLPGIFPYIPTVIFSRTTDRIGKGIRTAPRDALLAGYSNNNTGAVFGFHRAMDTLGAVIGPIAALIILYAYPGNYTLVFLIAFIPSIFAFGFTFVVKEIRSEGFVNKKMELKNFWRESPREYKVLLLLLTIFSLINSSDVFLILKSQKVSGSGTTAVFGYVFYNLIYAFSSFPIGLVSDKIGKKKVFVSGLFIFSFVYLIFSTTNSTSIIWISFALYGLYSSSTEGIAKAWVSDLVESRYRASAIGLLTSFMSIGIFIGSVLTGFLWDQFGSTVPFLISSCVSAIVAFILLKLD